MVCARLSRIYVSSSGDYFVVQTGDDVPAGCERAIMHIDLWNHNVEFIEQEDQWERPAVFVEFGELRWQVMDKPVGVRCYRCRGSVVRLHVVTDWHGSSAAGSAFMDESLKVFDLLDCIRVVLVGAAGAHFSRFDLIESRTNHNHEEIVENVESFSFVAAEGLLQDRREIGRMAE